MAVIGSAAVGGPGVVFGPGAVVGLGVVLGPGRWPLKWENPLFTLTHCNSRHFKVVCNNPGWFATIRGNSRAAPYICEVALAPRALRGTCRPLRPGQPRPAQASPAQRRPAQPSSAQIRPAQLRPAHASPGQPRPGQTSPGRFSPAQASPGQPRPAQASAAQVRPAFMKQNCFVCNTFLLF